MTEYIVYYIVEDLLVLSEDLQKYVEDIRRTSRFSYIYWAN
jgi:hypothetical protein